MKDVVVIYHAHCTDGFGSAYSAWKKFQDTAEYIPMDHGQTPPDLSGKDVYILDFSFPKETYLNILATAKSVRLIDHHQTAFENLEGCPGCFFDLSKSGARLAWEKFNPAEPVPMFIKYIEDADILKFEYDNTKFFYHGLHTIRYDFNTWTQLENPDYLEKIIEKGRSIQEYYLYQLHDIIKDAKPVCLDGVNGLMINTNNMFASDIGILLAQQCGTFALIWSERSNIVKCSLRSVKGFDCSIIAKKFGGGGQTQASAFNVKNVSLFNEMIDVEKNYLDKSKQKDKIKEIKNKHQNVVISNDEQPPKKPSFKK